MLACALPGGGLAAGIGSLLLYSTPSLCARLAFPSAITALAAVGACAPGALVVMTDDKQLSTVGPAPAQPLALAILDSTVLPRRGAALAVLPPPPCAGAAAAPVAVVGDKTGDVWALGALPRVSERRRQLLGHTASIVTCLALAGAGSARPLLLTGDRDEKVRASLWDAPSVVASFCLGHLRAVSALAPLGAHQFVSAGGDGALRLWDAPSGTLLHTLYLAARSGGGGGGGGGAAAGVLFEAQAMPPGAVHRDPDLVFSKKDFGGSRGEGEGGGGGGMEGEEEGGGEGAEPADLAALAAAATGGGGGGSDGSSSSAAAAPVIPQTAMGLVGPSELSPQVVAACLVPCQLGAAGAQHIVTFVVGERAVRLLAVEPGSAPIASAEPEAPPLQQSLLRSLGVLRLGGGAVPLHLTRAAEAASSSSSSSGAGSGAGSASALFFLATLSPSTAGAGGGAATRWVYKVVALEACAEGGVSGGAWEGGASAGTGGGGGGGSAACLREAVLPAEAQGGPGQLLAQLNAALEAESPPGLQPEAVAQAASLLTRNPVEYDKGSFPKLKNPPRH